MGIYYISACHDCKEQVMWAKCPIETAEYWHKDFHEGHNRQLSNDYDEDFYDKVWKYKNLGVLDGDEYKEKSAK